MAEKQSLTVEKVIEHHLIQNVGQKLTPHLIAGLVVMMSQNMHNSNLVVPTITLPTQPEA